VKLIQSRLLLVCAGAATLAVSLVSGPAAAAPQQAAKPAPAADTGAGGDAVEAAVQAYRKVYPQMSEAAARTAASQQELRKELHSRLVQDADTYGGGWFDAPSGVSHLALTTVAAEARAAQAGRELGIAVQTHRVARSFVELEKQAAALRTGKDAFSQAARGQVGIDVATNSVTVALASDQLNRVAKAVPAGVRVVPPGTVTSEADVCTARDNCNDSLRSGLVVTGSAGCSLGFTARGTTGVRWALTAGHCAGSTTSTWSTGGTSIGPLNPVNAIDSGAVDAGAIQVTNAGYAADTVGRIYISGTSWVGVKGSAPTLSFIWVGETVCLSARYQAPGTVGNPCAVVANTSDPTNRGLVRVEGYDACGGDSGGGWYWLPASGNRYAYGLHSRSSSGCNDPAAVSWFSALPMFWTALTYELG
jgi:streptogrisin C